MQDFVLKKKREGAKAEDQQYLLTKFNLILSSMGGFWTDIPKCSERG